MSKWLQSVLALCTIAVTAAICLLCWQTATQEQAIGDAATALTRQLNAMPDLAPTVQKLNQTVDAINAPCVGFHGSTTCGPIAQLSQTAKNVGIVAGLSAQQVKQSGVLIDSAAQAVQKVSTDLSGTAQAATGTLNAATGTLTTIQTQAGPLMAVYTKDGQDLDALLKSHALNQSLDNVQAITASGELIMANGARVTTKMADDYTKPSTPWGRFLHLGMDAFDVTAAVARHVP